MAKRKGQGDGADRPPNDAAVGYRRPPVAHRFRAGEPTRNPYGRRGKPRPVLPGLEDPDFLDEMVTLSVDGVPTRMTRDAALDHALFQQGLRGNVAAARRLDERQAERERRRRAVRATHADPTEAISDADEMLIAEALHRRNSGSAAEPARPGDPGGPSATAMSGSPQDRDHEEGRGSPVGARGGAR